tara:strand:+ start:548 stop:1525 length:978 start_codon:yes stop_codon:yes gene_type:complete
MVRIITIKLPARAFIYASFIVFFLVSVFRPLESGIDTAFYVARYIENASLTHSQFLDVYFSSDTKDPFFYYLSYLFSLLGFNEQAWLATIAFIFSLSVCLTVARYSKFHFLSFCLFLALGYVTFSFSGLRQTIALSITILSIPFLVERRALGFWSLVLLASLFHLSAISFSFTWFLNRKIKLIYLIIIVILVLSATLLFEHQIRVLISIFAPGHLSEYAERDVALNYTLLLINVAMVTFVLVTYFIKSINLSGEKLFLNIMILGLTFQCLSLIIAEFFRLALYFNVVTINLITWSLHYYETRVSRPTIYILILFSAVMLVLKSTS